MARKTLARSRRISSMVLLTGATLFQLGSCDFGSVTTTVTLDGRDLVLNVVRGVVLQPLDTFVTNAIDNLFSNDQ